MARLTVKIHPRAKVTRLAGTIGGAYKMDVAAPPVEGKANEACTRFLAEVLGVSRSRIRIVVGATSRTKVFDVEGVSQEALEQILATPSNHLPGVTDE